MEIYSRLSENGNFRGEKYIYEKTALKNTKNWLMITLFGPKTMKKSIFIAFTGIFSKDFSAYILGTRKIDKTCRRRVHNKEEKFYIYFVSYSVPQ